MRPIQFWLSARLDHSLARIDLPLLVDTELRDALIVWSETDWILQGVQLSSPNPDIYLFTDSSSEGWGATLSGVDVMDIWRGSDCFLHINHQELLAVKLALQHFLGEIQSKIVLLLCDNTTAVAYLRKEGGTRSRDLCLLSWEILHLCSQNDTRLLVRHIPSKHNVLVLVRLPPSGSWT